MKVPVLMQHFYEHKMNSTDLSFFDFISDHYRSGKAGHTDSEHHGLPFKSHECQHISPLLLFHEFPMQFKIELSASVLQTQSFQEDFYNSAARSAIWQPPQFTA